MVRNPGAGNNGTGLIKQGTGLIKQGTGLIKKGTGLIIGRDCLSPPGTVSVPETGLMVKIPGAGNVGLY